MGKQARKLSDFFGARRRKCTLLRGELLRSKGKERRMKLSVTMPLSNTELTECPTPFFDQFSVMEKQDSASNRATIDVEFDSMSVRLFSADVTVEPSVSIQGALLHKFAMIGEGTGEKRLVSLDFLIYLPATEALRLWEWEHIHSDFFLESVKAQGSLNLSGEADEEDDDENDEEASNPLDTAKGRSGAVVTIPPVKSGLKELAAFHAAETEQPSAGGRRKPGQRLN